MTNCATCDHWKPTRAGLGHCAVTRRGRGLMIVGCDFCCEKHSSGDGEVRTSPEASAPSEPVAKVVKIEGGGDLCPFCSGELGGVLRDDEGRWFGVCGDCEAQGPVKEDIAEALEAWEERA